MVKRSMKLASDYSIERVATVLDGSVSVPGGGTSNSQVEAGYDDPEKSNLFFKLHQLQTGAWGASSIGRITQVRRRDLSCVVVRPQP